MMQIVQFTAFLALFLTCTKFVAAQKNKATDEEVRQFYNSEAKFLNLKDGDTLVDIGASGGAINGMYSVVRSNLYQILTDIDKKRLNEKAVQSNYKYLKKLYYPTNTFSYSILLHKPDSIPLASNSFDKVLCRRSFHEFSNPVEMLSEIHRILRDSGNVIVLEGVPEKEGEMEPVCKKPFLKADYIISVFTRNGFQLQRQTEETMWFDNYRKLCVLTFKKA